jgi:hypothetical protein
MHNQGFEMFIFATFLVIWIICIATFIQDLQKELSWERTTGTVVGIIVTSGDSYGDSRYHPVITFHTDNNDDDITFTSEAHMPQAVSGDEIEVVYNPKNPSKGPESWEYIKTKLAFSGCFGLFTTMLAAIMTVYFCLSSDTDLWHMLGLRQHHFAPENISSANLVVDQGVVA